MSSTGRGGDRHPQDFYATPSWCVRRFLEAYPLPGGVWFEPCAGDGDLIRAVDRTDVTWAVNELREECVDAIFATGKAKSLTVGDILTVDLPEADVCITNPPFGCALEVLQRLLGKYKHIIFLQRVNWLAGPRADLFRDIKPSLYVLPNRPSFVKGTTDSTEYGWFVFDGKGEIKILNETPIAERRIKSKPFDKIAWNREYRKQNRDKILEYNRNYRKQNKEWVRSLNKKNYDNDPDKFKERSRNVYKKKKDKPEFISENRQRARVWREENLERSKNTGRAWRYKNAELVKQARRQWAIANPDARKASHLRRRALKRNAAGFCSKQQMLWRIELFGHSCAYCGGEYEHIDHSIALAKGGTNWPANMRPSCEKCNVSKNATSDWKFWTDKLKNGEAFKMAGLPRDMAQQVGNARTTGGSSYIQHGGYIFLVKKWFFQLSPQKERCIIVEFLVVDSQAKTVFEGSKEVRQTPNAIASDCSEVSNWDGAGKLSAPANSRAVVLGLFGFKENEVPDDKVVETLDACIGDAQPAAGMLLACSTFSKEKRTKPGEYITGRNWDCVARPGTGVNAPDQVAARMNLLRTSPVKAVQLARQQLGLPAFDEGAVTSSSAPAAGNGGGMFAGTPAAAPAAAAPAFAGFSAPAAPEVPSIPAAPSAPDPFAGWTKHPTAAGFWYQGQVVKSETDLLAGR